MPTSLGDGALFSAHLIVSGAFVTIVAIVSRFSHDEAAELADDEEELEVGGLLGRSPPSSLSVPSIPPATGLLTSSYTQVCVPTCWQSAASCPAKSALSARTGWGGETDGESEHRRPGSAHLCLWVCLATHGHASSLRLPPTDAAGQR